MEQSKYKQVEMLMGRLLIFIVVFIGSFVLVELVSRKFLSAHSPIEQRFPVQRFRHPRPYSMFAGKPLAADLNSLVVQRNGSPDAQNTRRISRFLLRGINSVRGKAPDC